jgi:hypothetical protein
VELGVGTYRGVGPPITFSGDLFTEFFQWLGGSTDDLACAPLPGGSERFASNDDYVRQVASVSLRLVLDRFVLLSDALQMIRDARASGIGDCP